MHAKEIAERVIASGRCTSLKGKTPEATITAMLAVGSKPGGPFTRIDKGIYTLAGTLSKVGAKPKAEMAETTKATTTGNSTPPKAKAKSTTTSSEVSTRVQ